MASGLKVADLFAELGIELDEASLRKADAFLKKAGKRTDKWSKKISTRLSKTWSALAGPTMAIGAGLVFAGKDALEFEDSLTRLQISAVGAAGTVDEMREQMLRTSKETGVAKEEIASAVAQFVALTGRGDMASDAMKTFARVAKATGTPMEDVAAAAAGMTTNMKIKPGDFEKAFSILVKGGKAGAVELKDMAGLLSELAPLMTQFKGGEGVKGLADLGAMMQIVMRGAGGSAEKAATQTSRFMESFTSPRTLKALKNFRGKDGKKGIKVFDEKTVNGKKVVEMRNLFTILDDMHKAGVFDDERNLSKIFESSEARAAARQVGALRGEVSALSKETLNAQDIAKDYDTYQASNAAKISKAWNDVKIAVAEAFTPERIALFTSALIQVLQIAADIVDKISRIGGYLDSREAAGEAGTTAYNKALSEGKSFLEAQKAGSLAEDAALEQGALRQGSTVGNPAYAVTNKNEAQRQALYTMSRSAGAITRAANSVVINVNGSANPEATAKLVKREFDRNMAIINRDIEAAAGG